MTAAQKNATTGTVAQINGQTSADADDPPRRYSRELPRDRSSVREARSYAVTCAPDHPRPDDIRVAASELATNCVEHGCGMGYTLTVERSAAGVRVVVVNETAGSIPHLVDPSDDGEHGRGLHVVLGVAELTIKLTVKQNGRVVETSAFLPHEWTYAADL